MLHCLKKWNHRIIFMIQTMQCCFAFRCPDDCVLIPQRSKMRFFFFSRRQRNRSNLRCPQLKVTVLRIDRKLHRSSRLRQITFSFSAIITTLLFLVSQFQCGCYCDSNCSAFGDYLLSTLVIQLPHNSSLYSSLIWCICKPK